VIIQPHPYQREALDAFSQACARGQRRNIVQLPTGTGKTIVATFCARERSPLGRVLFLCHLDEIAQQTIQKFRTVWPDASVGLVKAETREWGRQVTIASVQTVCREAALAELVQHGPYRLVVADECHHAPTPTWARVLEATVDEAAGTELLGLSATPNRPDGRSLEPWFTEIVYRMSVLDAIEQGYLSDIEGRVVPGGYDLDALQSRNGDFEVKALSEMMQQPHVLRKSVQAVHSYAPDRQILVFCVDVQHSKTINEMLRRGGIRSEHLDGETPLDKRRDIISRFARGELQVITNCAVLTEGFDAPGISCILLLRPTESDSLFIQMVGRGLRRGPDPRPCLVLDVSGNSERHSIVQLGTLAGLQPTKRMVKALAGRGVVEVGRRDHPKHIPSLLAYATGVDADARALDLKTAVQARRYEWVHTRWGYAMDLGRAELGFLILRPVGDTGTLFRVVRIFRGRDEWRARYEVLTQEAISLDWAVGLAEAAAARFVGGRAKGKWWERTADWRQQKPTPAQEQLLQQLGVDGAPASKGEAAMLITRAAVERDVAGFAVTPWGRQARAHLRHLLHEGVIPPDTQITEDWQVDQLPDGDARRLQARMLSLAKKARGSDAA